MKNVFVMVMMVLCLASAAFGLSDKEYRQMMRNAEFKRADSALNQAWKNARDSLSGSAFDELKKSQSSWIKSGRDNEAKQLIQKKMNRTKAYATVTSARAEYINGYVHDMTTEPELPEDDIEPDDLPTDDLPDDLPDDDLPDYTTAPTQPTPTVTLASEGEASEYLEERLIDLGRIAPNEALEYLGTTDINGESCYEFSSQFNFSETGRYAISPSGKIYAYDGDNYVPAN